MIFDVVANVMVNICL